MRRSSAASSPPTEFRDPRAVEAWDCSFRWRCDGELRDITIEDTWARVAGALTDQPQRRAAYRDAFSRWRLLPDARLLRLAGTDATPRLEDRIDAVLNAAVFAARHKFDHGAFAATAALAKALIEDARAFAAPGVTPAIGLIGFDEACDALGLDPAGHEAHELALRLTEELAVHAGRQAVRLTPQPLLARLANHVSDGVDGAGRDALHAAVDTLSAVRA